MTQEISDQSEPEITINQVQKTPGQQLRQAREVRKYGIEEVAKNLRLSAKMVAKIEDDDYAAMGAIAFARGYVRSYAKFLNLPEEKIMQSFDALDLESKIQSNKPKLIYEKMTRPPTHSLFRRLLYVIFLVVVASGLYWWHNHTGVYKSVNEDKTQPTTISELNQQGISQVVDPQAHTVISQPLPVEVLNAENANKGPETPSTKSSK